MNALVVDLHFYSKYNQVLDYVHGEELLSYLCYKDNSNPLFTIRKKRDKQLILKAILQNILQYNKKKYIKELDRYLNLLDRPLE